MTLQTTHLVDISTPIFYCCRLIGFTSCSIRAALSGCLSRISAQPGEGKGAGRERSGSREPK